MRIFFGLVWRNLRFYADEALQKTLSLDKAVSNMEAAKRAFRVFEWAKDET